jgi:HlyD family secretion protein
MDTAIPESTIRKQRNKRWLLAGGILVLLVLALIMTWSFLSPTIRRSEITTAVAAIGNMENTVSASGEVLPEFEETITSSIDGSIQKVLKNEGSSVKAGESIVTLDKSQTQNDLEKLTYQLASKRGEIDKLRLDLSQSYSDIQSSNDIKQLHIGNLTDAVENAKRLFDAGGGTREAIEQAQFDLKVAQQEKKQLENQIASKQLSMKVDISQAEIAADIQESDLKALQRKISLADAATTRGGIITYVDKNIGSTIRQGETLARVADLSSFKVTGSLSDAYLDQIKVGMPTIVRDGDTLFRGHVVNVYPSVQGGIVTFDIRLDLPNNPILRPNLKVDVFLVTASHNGVVRVANGPAFRGGKVQDIFILKGGVALKQTVHLGLSSFDFVEIQDGVRPGDTVITSDMSDYRNTQRLKVKY